MSYELRTDYKCNAMQIYNSISLNQGKIDSFDLLLPFDEIQILTKDFDSIVHEIDLSTGEIIKDSAKPKKIKPIEYNGINFRISVCLTTPNLNFPLVKEKKLRITVTSKMAKELYFYGCSHYTSDKIIETINDSGLIKITKDQYLNGLPLDIDVCQDNKIPLELYTQAIKTLPSLVLETKAIIMKTFWPKQICSAKKNIGIQFNNRDNKTELNPFVKIYNKENDLKTESLLFYETYLKANNINITDLRRKEVNICNSASKRQLKTKNIIPLDQPIKTLNDWFNLSTDTLTNISNYMPTIYFNKHVTQRQSRTSLALPDQIILTFIENEVNQGKSYEQILTLLDVYGQNAVDRKKRSRLKEKINFLYSIMLDDSNLLKKAKQNEDVWNVILDWKLW